MAHSGLTTRPRRGRLSGTPQWRRLPRVVQARAAPRSIPRIVCYQFSPAQSDDVTSHTSRYLTAPVNTRRYTSASIGPPSQLTSCWAAAAAARPPPDRKPGGGTSPACGSWRIKSITPLLVLQEKFDDSRESYKELANANDRLVTVINPRLTGVSAECH